MPYTYITFFGGAISKTQSELGGVQIHVEDDLADFMLDDGQRPDHYGNYYRHPNVPKRYNRLNILEARQLIPKISGMNRHDLEIHRGNNPGIIILDGIVWTHPHYDHVGNVGSRRPDLITHTHPYGKAVLYCWQMTSGSSDNQFVYTKEQYSMFTNTNGEPRFITGKKTMFPRKFHLFESGQRTQIGDMPYTAYPVDHSTIAHGLEFESSVGNIGVSGDLRKRGRRPQDTENFVQALEKADLQYLLWEGSLLHFDHYGTEDDVKEEISKRLKGKAFAAIAFPPRDLDRIVSVYGAAKENKRMLVLNYQQYILLRKFNGINGYPRINWKYVGFMLPPKNKGILEYEDEYPPELVAMDYNYNERFLLGLERWRERGGHEGKPQLVKLEDIANNQDQFLVYFPRTYFDFLESIQPKENSVYIRSHPAPWTPDMEIDEWQIINYLKDYNMYSGPCPDIFNPAIMRNMLQIHVTGHLNKYETKEILDRFNCILIPYHTTDPRLFYELYPKKRILIPERLKRIKLPPDPEDIIIPGAT